MRRIKVIITAFAILSVLLTGCGNSTSGARTQINEDGKKIVVLSDQQATSTKADILVKKIDQFGNINITDWLNEDTFIFSKRNEALQKVEGNYPLSLYLSNIKTSEETVFLAEEEENLEGARLSSDRKYVAFIKYSAISQGIKGVDMNLFVMDVEAKKQIKLFDNIRQFNWTENNRIIFNGSDGNTYVADVEGNISNISKQTGKLLKNDAAIVQDKLYYIDRAQTQTFGGDLYVLDLATGNSKLLRHFAEYFKPSLDQKNAILLLRPDQNSVSLSITNLDGEDKTVICKQEGEGIIMRAWWSPDQKYIAYSIVKNIDSPNNGLYIYNTLSGKSTQIAVDVHDPFVEWSTSSARLAISILSGQSSESKVVYLEVNE